MSLLSIIMAKKLVLPILNSNLMLLLRNYASRVLGDSGEIDNSFLVKKAYLKLPAQDSIVFAWFGGAGSKKRTT